MESHLLNIRGSVFFFLSLLWALNAHALYGGRTINQVPIEKLAKNIQNQLEKTNAPQERATLLINLGRLYGMAFAKATNSAPVDEGNRGRNDNEASFGEWLNQSPSAYPHLKPFLPLRPESGSQTEEHRKFLRKSIDSFREALKIEPENSLGQLGLAWTLTQNGEKEEAKSFLKKLLDSNKIAFNFDEFRHSGSVQVPFDPTTSSIKIKLENKTLAEGRPFPLAVRTKLRNARLPADKNPLAEKLEGPIEAYLKSPSQLNFDALLAAFDRATLSEKEVFAGPYNEEKSPTIDLRDDLIDLHARHSEDITFAGQIEKMLSASGPRDCEAGKKIDIQFYESTVDLNLVCLSRLAAKAKNLDHCKSISQPGKKYATCVTYVAYRLKDTSICKEGLRGSIGDEEIFSKFSYAEQCYEIVSETLKRKTTFKGYPRFFSKSDWNPSTLKLSSGEIEVRIYPTQDKGARFGEVNFSPHRKFTALDGGNQPDIFDLLLLPQEKRELLKWRKTFSIDFFNKAGKKISSSLTQVTLPFPASDAGAPTPDFKIENALQSAATAEAAFYYVSLLDQEKDKLEIELTRQRVWVEHKAPRFHKRELTPLAISLNGSSDVADILNSNTSVKFDLIGNGTIESWNWIRPSSAWLVYRSPLSPEPISAMHLFGNSTFWLFWQNGFQPLCALDSSGNQMIEGAELNNIFLWTDKNLNGVEDTEEIQTLDSYGIKALDCRHSIGKDGLLRSLRGAVLSNGKSLPIVDVILRRR